ncbi:MAG: transcriptional repressor [Rhodospirillaceae bacterium]|jgi:Fur family transcriptional regulator, zinc uptake regulator|nr:transcriptional repressor [Rhodospirillaceae bacterium]MBT5244373.1 transcriptional repressor [Rhodospirillaceae bacterium]MBT5563734.1 transcriptional repressor [Rhodospirillaceae bacterium]MBT6241564.1 transcriptional repressor [Rhodospirillaceae bacterium]
MQSAVDLCNQRGARLTTLRRRVLELIWKSHKPVGAYELLDILKTERRNAQPPTVYRALDFLLELGLVHRIESLNAFIGCCAPDTTHSSQFLICRDCGAAAEISDNRLDKAIEGLADEAGFSVLHRIIEVAGHCPNCRVPGHE